MAFFDGADVALADAQDEEAAVQQVIRAGNRVLRGHLAIVEVGPAFGDGPAGGGLAGHDLGLGHQVHYGWQAAAAGEDPDRGHLGDGRLEGPLVDLGQVATAEQGLAGGDRAVALLRAVHQRGDLLGQGTLSRPSGGARYAFSDQGVDLVAGPEAVDPQQAGHLDIGHVEPELVERVRRHQIGAEPDRAALGLAVFGAVRLGDQRNGQGVHGRALDPPDQVHPADQVAPLVAAAQLQDATVPPVQFQEVHGLQKLVAELGEAEPAALQPGLHRLAVQHPVDREVLADVAQEVEHEHRAGPFQVANDQRAGLPGVEVEEPGLLAADPLYPLRHDLARVEHSLGRLTARVADQPGSPADQPDRPGPRQLK